MARGATVTDNLEKANSSVVCGSTYLRLLHAAATDVQAAVSAAAAAAAIWVILTLAAVV